MRVSENMKSMSLLGEMNRTMERMVKTQSDISSTKMIHKPSDDPAGTSRAMRLKETMARYERYASNVDDGLQWLNVTDSALSSTEEIVSQAEALLLQASNDTLGASTRRTLSTTMQSLW
jgi:flagellar hook-associated protein 3 FlgL